MKAWQYGWVVGVAMLFCYNSLAQGGYLKQRIKAQKQSYKVLGRVIDSPLKTIDNKSVTLSSYQGKLLVIDFWFTTCGPCFQQFPYMDTIKQMFADEPDLLFVNICSISAFDDWKKTVEQKNIQGIHLFDDNTEVINRRIIGSPRPSGEGTVHGQLYLSGYPGFAFIDANGKVLGATNITPQTRLLFAYYIECMLKGKNIQQALEQFSAEVNRATLTDEFLAFLKKRLGATPDTAYQLVAPHKKLL
ncbi:MAG: TlpA family protein disulfide reductase [Bacteroidetes bacterium]|nr:MAG: TlpA family protein disulfide reductase [Bacteroidota bacterium]